MAEEDSVGQHVAVGWRRGLGGQGAFVMFDRFFEGGLATVAQVEGTQGAHGVVELFR